MVGIHRQKGHFLIPAVHMGVMLMWCLFVTQPSRADTGVVYKEARPMKSLARDEAEKPPPAEAAEKAQPNKPVGEAQPNEPVGKATRPTRAVNPAKKKSDSEERLVKVGNGTDKTGKEGKADEEYLYDPRGKIDPFVPFILTPEKGFSYSGGTTENTAAEMLKKLREAKTELQTIKLSELTLTAIIKADDKIWAMVSGPGGRGYILKKGTFVGTEGGIVEQVVYEDKKTPFGVEPVRKVIIKEPYVDVSGNLAYRLVEKEMSFQGKSAVN